MAEQKRRGAPMGGTAPRGMMPGEKAKDFKGTMRKLLHYLGKYLPAIIAVIAVCHRFHRVFHHRPEDSGQRHHQAV